MSRCGWSGPAAARNPPPMLQFMRSKKTDGLVLTSSMSVSNRKGIAVTEMPLEKITVPTLVVAHRQDGCSKTPPEGGGADQDRTEPGTAGGSGPLRGRPRTVYCRPRVIHSTDALRQVLEPRRRCWKEAQRNAPRRHACQTSGQAAISGWRR